AQFNTVIDPSRTFSISYPKSWRRVQPGAADAVLLAEGPNGASLLVSKTQISGPVTAANLPSARKLTDRVVKSGQGMTILRAPQQVTLGGLPGYLYLYTFGQRGGQPGAHAHYFLFRGATLVTLVFQAVPASRVIALAHEFDRIAATFRAL